MPSSRFIRAMAAVVLFTGVALMWFETPRATISAISSKLKTATTRADFPPVIYGHVHMAKTGGTSLNVLMANRYQRVCGNKGYSYDAHAENERAKAKAKRAKRQYVLPTGRSSVDPEEMDEIGYEECDYVSFERTWRAWNETFPGGTLRGVPVELHVPCRDPAEHLMSMCNHRRRTLDCNASSDEEFYRSVDRCGLYLDRFRDTLRSTFDVRCFDFDRQFTAYAERMSHVLQRRRFESTPVVARVTNNRRKKKTECIWRREELVAKAVKYLADNYDYYDFCNKCMGTAAEITGN